MHHVEVICKVRTVRFNKQRQVMTVGSVFMSGNTKADLFKRLGARRRCVDSPGIKNWAGERVRRYQFIPQRCGSNMCTDAAARPL